jgi:ABC-type cobalamin/Fe3+-siderophores transport system ATPase subunit
MKTLAGVLKPLSGSLPAAQLGMAPTRIPKVKGSTVREFATLSAGDHPVVEEALKILGIEDLAVRDIATLSDGQFQKACIATALTRRAGLILLDEPTAFLDTENRIQVLEAIKRAARTSGSSILFSSHDLYDARKVADREISLTS